MLVCLFVCLFVCFCLCFFVCSFVSSFVRSFVRSVCLFVCMSVCSFICLLACWFVCLYVVCLSVCLSVCLPACLPVCLLDCSNACLLACAFVCLFSCFGSRRWVMIVSMRLFLFYVGLKDSTPAVVLYKQPGRNLLPCPLLNIKQTYQIFKYISSETASRIYRAPPPSLHPSPFPLSPRNLPLWSQSVP